LKAKRPAINHLIITLCKQYTCFRHWTVQCTSIHRAISQFFSHSLQCLVTYTIILYKMSKTFRWRHRSRVRIGGAGSRRNVKPWHMQQRTVFRRALKVMTSYHIFVWQKV